MIHFKIVLAETCAMSRRFFLGVFSWTRLAEKNVKLRALTTEKSVGAHRELVKGRLIRRILDFAWFESNFELLQTCLLAKPVLKSMQNEGFS